MKPNCQLLSSNWKLLNYQLWAGGVARISRGRDKETFSNKTLYEENLYKISTFFNLNANIFVRFLEIFQISLLFPCNY